MNLPITGKHNFFTLLLKGQERHNSLINKHSVQFYTLPKVTEKPREKTHLWSNVETVLLLPHN